MLNKTEALLIKLMEECAEVQQAAAKSLLYGLSSDNWGNLTRTNEQHLADEINDALGAIDALKKNELFANCLIPDVEGIRRKEKKLREFFDRFKIPYPL